MRGVKIFEKKNWAKIENMISPDHVLYWKMIKINHFKIEREELIYPWQSLVAEFGGALGLFLGFSFMTIWDSVVQIHSFKI